MKRTGGTLIDVDAVNWKITSRRQGSNLRRQAKKGKVYYIQYRSIPFRYFGVPSETCWGQTFKVKIKE